MQWIKLGSSLLSSNSPLSQPLPSSIQIPRRRLDGSNTPRQVIRLLWLYRLRSQHLSKTTTLLTGLVCAKVERSRVRRRCGGERDSIDESPCSTHGTTSLDFVRVTSLAVFIATPGFPTAGHHLRQVSAFDTTTEGLSVRVVRVDV